MKRPFYIFVDAFYSRKVDRMKFRLPSFAKINLGLRVIGKRTDGYHDIETIFQTISLADYITFEKADDISLKCSDRSIPVDDKNLIIKAAKLLADRFSIDQGASIFLEKNIPSPGGLGGGSSNAAMTLLGLRHLWGMDVEQDDLVSIAAELGSDVPYFLTGGTSLGTGRGEIIKPIYDEFESDHIIIITPNIAVSTAEAYGQIPSDNLTKNSRDNILINCRFEAGVLIPDAATLENDFENPIFDLYPEIARVKQWLLQNGALSAVMSGSGASVAGFFENKETRQTAFKALGDQANWRSFAVATISRSKYREALSKVF